VWVGLLANNGFQRFNSQNTASILTEAESKGLELSSSSQGFIAFIGSETPAFSWTPNIWTACFLLAVISVLPTHCSLEKLINWIKIKRGSESCFF